MLTRSLVVMAKGDGRAAGKGARKHSGGCLHPVVGAGWEEGQSWGWGRVETGGSEVRVWGKRAGRTIAVILDEEGTGPCLLPLLGQVHEAPAERGQRPGETHRGEELEQVWPEDL